MAPQPLTLEAPPATHPAGDRPAVQSGRADRMAKNGQQGGTKQWAMPVWTGLGLGTDTQDSEEGGPQGPLGARAGEVGDNSARGARRQGIFQVRSTRAPPGGKALSPEPLAAISGQKRPGCNRDKLGEARSHVVS